MAESKIGLPIVWMIALSLFTFVAYLPAMQGPFVFDDRGNIVDNAGIAAFPPKLDWFNPASRWVVSLTFSINYWMGGWETWSFHVTNVLLHVGCGWLIAILASYILAASSQIGDFSDHLAINGAFWVASIWMLHPINSSAVAYIVQRSEILAACATVGFLIAIIFDSQTKDRRWQWVAAALFVTGICSKTNAISALPVAILMDRLLLSNSWITLLKRRGLLYLLPMALGGVSLWILFPGLRRGDAGVGFSPEIPSLPIYLATQSQVFWHYLALCVWPSELSIDYRWPPVESVAAALPWIAASVAVLGLGVWRFRRQKLDGWLILSLFLLLAPTSTLIPITDIAVDHRMYLGSSCVIGYCLYVVRQLLLIRPNWAFDFRHARLPLLFALLVCLFFRTYTRAQDWSSGFDLWLSAAKVTPSNARALQNLTSSAIDEGRERELISVMEELKRRTLVTGTVAPAVASRLGEEYLKIGDVARAEPLLRNAIDGLAPARSVDERKEYAAARVNLALVCLQEADFDEAESHLRVAVHSDPQLAYGYAMLGDILMRKSAFEEAAKHFRSALAIQPEWEQVKDDLAKAIMAGRLP